MLLLSFEILLKRTGKLSFAARNKNNCAALPNYISAVAI